MREKNRLIHEIKRFDHGIFFTLSEPVVQLGMTSRSRRENESSNLSGLIHFLFKEFLNVKGNQVCVSFY
jgi:hypothetical protein